ncbi:hypothetical protein SETIT_4G124300v2 [Setaria italica]|uniref:PHD-type domain-containing protein n=1 Tax=Setaria italica TaxID=4555 RepID=K3XVG9_SETIT|nr:uncharacterized protein LOC101772949 [Setaria italica]RCV21254.1 hypothetical protein SETIT_4G124300v2 [Setaria italica]
MAAPAGGDSRPLPPSPSSKGKAKMDDEAEADSSGKMCGICYVDGRQAIRGELDCCAHYFCFVCIMAWGRVESRCPFCKARFRTIRRPPVPGRFPDERIVTVPERNQVYHPQGNGSSTVGVDPYAETICTVCNGSRDDELLLLCELCDAAAHTYCAGLGTTVPEGDWFCKDCATVREEQLRWLAENEGRGAQDEFEVSIDVLRAEPVAAPSVRDVVDELECDPDRAGVGNGRLSMDDQVPSIYDIVDDDFPTVGGIGRRPGKNTEDLPSQGASSAGSQHPGLTKGRDNGLGAYHACIRLEVERARTLRNSRNLDKRIRELRENWAALRDGSVGFAPRVPNGRGKDTGSTSAATDHQRHRQTTPATASYRNGAPATSAQQPRPSPEETSTSLGHSKKVSHKDARDAHKAWKRLEIAKTSGGRKISSKPASLSCSTPFSMGNRSTSYSPIDSILGQKNGNLPNKVSQHNRANCGQGTEMESTPPTEYTAERRSLPEDRHAWVHERTISFRNRINEESLNGKVDSSTQDQHVDQPLASSCSTGGLEKSKSGMLHPLKCSSSSGQSPVISSLQLGPRAGSQSTMMVNPEEPSAVCAATTNEIGSAATAEVRKSSRADRHERKRKHSSEKCSDEGPKRSRSACKIAKSEISSLAVRELKLLKIDKTHGSETFKEVARTATHTVLASCGFEHSPSQSLALSRPVCKHSPKVKAQMSSAIIDSCRECLRSSVKEAISLALLGRHMDQTGASC